MANSTVFKKGTARQIKRSIKSPRLAHKLSKAIVQLESDDIERLVRIGKVKKIHEVDGMDLYAYRVTPTERIVFSSIGKGIYVYDVISATGPDNVQSLLSSVAKDS